MGEARLMVALPPLVPDVNPTAAAIYENYRKSGAAEKARSYLGGSIIGKPCERALYYDFRWATTPEFSGRLYRLFQTGHREEDRVIADLIAAGLQVWARNPSTGKQWSWSDGDVGHHLAGNADGIVQKVPEAPAAAHILEVKTHNTKSFKDLKDKGVEKSKPLHYAQMQKYMGWSISEFGKTNGCQRALYVAVCKETDEIYVERIRYDEEFDQRLVAKAQRVVFANSLPTRISDDPSWFECKFCNHAPTCHGDRVPNVSCRTCAHSTPEFEPHADGTPRWTCSCGTDRGLVTLPVDHQRTGCDQHLFLPFLLANWAEAIDSNGSSVKYHVKATGKAFVNGNAGPTEITSAEICAAGDKRALIDSGVQEFREVFGARIAA